MNFFCVGLNHKTAGVDLRERISFTSSQLKDSLQKLTSKSGIHGAVVLSTCNRTEFYLHALSADSAYEGVCAFIEEEKDIIAADIAPHLYTFEEAEAVRHLFSVVSSLDSMVLGEAQIAGQVREAFKVSHSAGCATMLLHKVFRTAREVGKRVRNQTGIGDAHVSLSTVAVDVAKDKFGDLHDRTILIVGSGKMSELAAMYLQEQGASSLLVASRTHAHACTVAKAVGGDAHYFEELNDLVPQADIIISSTSAPHYVIVPETLEAVAKPVLLLDLAMPRDVDPACANIEGVSLCDLDDLGTIAAMNQRSREMGAQDAQAIVDEEVKRLELWAAQHAVTPTIKQLRAYAEEIRSGEVEHLLRKLETPLSERDQIALEAATNAMVKKLLHTPTAVLRDSAVTHTDYETVEAVRKIFGFEEAPVDEEGTGFEVSAGRRAMAG